ncbi:MAG: hypothetical protein IJZ47_10900, partial [Oscillospiraceae bacterium]|nr:hypothetical protein [Oscillospiraceae bacterium]
MGLKVVKYNTYRLIDNNSFELPLPFRFEMFKKDLPVAEYIINEEEDIICNVITKHKEDVLTPLRRPLSLSDIHYLFSCRVFQDRTPYTAHMLKCVGLEKYNVYEIITRTHGIIPYDNYWIRFDGEQLNFEQATELFDAMMAEPIVQVVPQPAAAQEPVPDVSEILSQHTIDVSNIVARDGAGMSQSEAENMVRTAVAYTPVEEEDEVVNNKMSEDEIEALLMKAGIAPPPPMSDEAIDEMFSVNSEPEETSAGGGMMSQEAIEAMLAAATAAAEPEPAPSGGMMSQEAIEAMLAANAPAEAPASEPSDGGKMSQDDIAALFAANAAAEPEPAPAPVEEAPASGGKMSQDDIAALFAANAAAEPEPAPVEEAPASGGKMSQDDIAALFAANAAAEPEPAPAPVEEAPATGGK